MGILDLLFGRTPRRQNSGPTMRGVRDAAALERLSPTAREGRTISIEQIRNEALANEPFWRRRGLDSGLLDEDVSGLENYTSFELMAPDYDVLEDFAQRQGYDRAASILRFLRLRGVTSAPEAILQLEASGELARVPKVVLDWLWYYVVRHQDYHLLKAMQSQPYVPRSLLESIVQMEDEKCEYVYLMEEEGTVPPVCKIGRTVVDPLARERQLNSSTSQYRRIRLVAYWRVRDSAVVEANLFELFADYRLHERREFFQVEPKMAAHLIERHLSSR